MYLFLMSVFSLGPRSDLHKFMVLKSQQLKENFSKRPEMAYLNLFTSLSIQGELPPEYL